MLRDTFHSIILLPSDSYLRGNRELVLLDELSRVSILITFICTCSHIGNGEEHRALRFAPFHSFHRTAPFGSSLSAFLSAPPFLCSSAAAVERHVRGVRRRAVFHIAARFRRVSDIISHSRDGR